MTSSRMRFLPLCLLLLFGLGVLPGHTEDERDKPPPPDGAPVGSAADEEIASKADAIESQVEKLFAGGEYKTALPLAREVVSLRKQVLDKSDPAIAGALNTLAVLLLELGEFQAAVDNLTEAAAILRATAGEEHPDLAAVLNSLGWVYLRWGKPDLALAHFQHALEMRARALPTGDPRIAESHNSLAVVLYQTDKLAEALVHAKKALAIYETTLGGQHQLVAQSLGNLGVMLERTGNLEESLHFLERAHSIYEHLLGPQHPHVGGSCANLGDILLRIGLPGRARLLHERAVDIRTQALGEGHPLVADSLASLGHTLTQLGLFDEAEPLLRRSLRIREKTFGGDHLKVAEGLASLASMYRAMEAHEEALPLMERALAIGEDSLGSEHPQVARLLTELAISLRWTGSLERALALHLRAISILNETRGPLHVSTGIAHNSAALALKDLGRRPEAREHYALSLKAIRTTHGDDHPHMATWHENMAWLCQDDGDTARAHDHALKALHIAESYILKNLLVLTDADRIALLHHLRRFLDTVVEMETGASSRGYAEVMRIKGLATRLAAAERTLWDATTPDTRIKAGELRAIERTLTRLANDMPPPRDKVAHDAWQVSFATARTTQGRLARELSAAIGDRVDAAALTGQRLQDVQGRLRQDTVFVDVLRTRGSYFAWALRSEGDPVRMNLGSSDQIDSEIAALLEQVVDSESSKWRQASRTLGERLASALAPALDDTVERVILCPDAALTSLPYGVLPESANGSGWLGSRTIHMVSQVSDLSQDHSGTTAAGSLVVGAVNYEEAALEPRTAMSEQVHRRAWTPSHRGFVPLGSTQAEIAMVAKRAGGTVTVLSGSRATEAQFRASAPGMRLIHLATHGFMHEYLFSGLGRSENSRRWLGAREEQSLDAGHDPLSLTGLAMAGANARRGGSDDDGILSALEVAGMKLPGCQLVVLSACETARGHPQAGEGVLGLIRGFRTAGAERVLGSLWRVDDEATTALMAKFYERLDQATGSQFSGAGAADALREAQEFIRSQKKWEHPYYWGAWVLWGTP